MHARGPAEARGGAEGGYGNTSKGSSKAASNCNSNVVSPTIGAATPSEVLSPTALPADGDYFSLVEERNASLEVR